MLSSLSLALTLLSTLCLFGALCEWLILRPVLWSYRWLLARPATTSRPVFAAQLALLPPLLLQLETILSVLTGWMVVRTGLRQILRRVS